MEKNNKISFYAPEGLNIEEIAGYDKSKHTRYLWFIHTIIFKSLSKKEEFGRYTNLKSLILKEYMGSTAYRPLIEQLEKADIITINEKYSTKNFSKSYRLSDRFIDKKIVSTTYVDKHLSKKRIQFAKSELEESFKLEEASTEFNKLKYARIDVESAIKFIDANYDADTRQYKTRLLAIKQYDAMHRPESYVDGANVGFTFIVNKGRIYSPVTMLSRDLEQFTYFEGYDNGSVCMDMPNSQLCFFNEMTKREQKEDREYTTEDSNDNNILQGKIYSNIEDNYISLWENCIYNGLGYEELMTKCNYLNKYVGWSKEERFKFKKRFFGQLFYNRYDDALTDMEIVFMQYHETEAVALRSAKRKYGNKGLAIRVQSLEADFFHGIISDYMYENHPKIPYTIKHDSITMPAEPSSYIKDELNSLVSAFFGSTDLKLKAELL